jgi:hypothetical protein
MAFLTTSVWVFILNGVIGSIVLLIKVVLVFGNKVNDDIFHYFQTQKGHLSPILFNIVAHVLVILISRAKENGQVDLLIPHLVDG